MWPISFVSCQLNHPFCLWYREVYFKEGYMGHEWSTVQNRSRLPLELFKSSHHIRLLLIPSGRLRECTIYSLPSVNNVFWKTTDNLQRNNTSVDFMKIPQEAAIYWMLPVDVALLVMPSMDLPRISLEREIETEIMSLSSRFLRDFICWIFYHHQLFLLLHEKVVHK